MIVALALGALSLPACRSPECSTLPAGAERDGCLHTEAASAAKSGDLERAYVAIRSIEGTIARAAAIDAVVATAPTQVDGVTVAALCATLARPFSDECLKTWDRPHLWNDPNTRNR